MSTVLPKKKKRNFEICEISNYKIIISFFDVIKNWISFEYL